MVRGEKTMELCADGIGRFRWVYRRVGDSRIGAHIDDESEGSKRLRRMID